METPRVNLGGFMAALLTGHALYFNRRHGGVGALLVEGDGYLLKRNRYIQEGERGRGSLRGESAARVGLEERSKASA